MATLDPPLWSEITPDLRGVIRDYYVKIYSESEENDLTIARSEVDALIAWLEKAKTQMQQAVV